MKITKTPIYEPITIKFETRQEAALFHKLIQDALWHIGRKYTLPWDEPHYKLGLKILQEVV